MKVLYSGADLLNVALYLQLVETLTPTQKLIQRLVLAKLKEDVDVLGVFKEVLEAYNMVLVKRAVNFNLRHQLLFGTRLCQSRLCNNFGR